MVEIDKELVAKMINKEEDKCRKCGMTCEHGWDAHVVTTSRGVTVLCDDCYCREEDSV